MDINNFKSSFYFNVRNSGTEYYNENRIKSVKRIKKGEYQALVKGSKKEFVYCGSAYYTVG